MIFATDKGIPFRSRAHSLVAGDNVVVDLAFLSSPMNRLKAPVVRELAFHFNGAVGGVTGGFDNKDGCSIFSKILIRDRGGSLHDLPGKLVRRRMQIEYGDRGEQDADTIADAASGATSTGANMVLRVPFDLEQAHKGDDTALPLLHLVDGGSIELSIANPSSGTLGTATVTVYALIHDEKEREMKSRLVVKDLAVTAQEDHYPLQGAVRLLEFSSNPTAPGYSAYTAATYSVVNIPELELSQHATHMLRSEWRRIRWDVAANDTVLAATPAGLIVVFPSKGQRIDKMPYLDSIRADIGGAAPTSARLLVSMIRPRVPDLAAQWMGYSDAQRFLHAVNTKGFVKLGGGRHYLRDGFPAHLAQLLPIGIEGRV